MRTNKKEIRDTTAKQAEKVSNEGHYLDRLENLAIALSHRESVMAVAALKILYAYSSCKPTGSDGILYDISMRLLIVAEKDHKFTKDQLNRLWYGVHWDAAKAFGLEFPYSKEQVNDKMRGNT